MLQLLPEETQASVRKALRLNAWPLGGGVAVLIATLVFALYSSGLPVIRTPASNTQSVAAADSPSEAEGDLAVDTTIAGVGGATGTTPAGARTGDHAAPAPRRAAPVWRRLYSGAADTQGITDDAITVCGHAPLEPRRRPQHQGRGPPRVLAPPQRPGRHPRPQGQHLARGRPVLGQGGVPAAQRCEEQNPFFIFGSVGSDVVPPVRDVGRAEPRALLLRLQPAGGPRSCSTATRRRSRRRTCRRVIGRLATTKFAAKKTKVGLLWRNSSNVEPGRDAFKARDGSATAARSSPTSRCRRARATTARRSSSCRAAAPRSS